MTENFNLTAIARRMFGIKTESDSSAIEGSQEWAQELEASANHMQEIVRGIDRSALQLGEALKRRDLVTAAEKTILIRDGVRLLREVCGIK